jgi:hypothetical protein
MKDSSRKFPPQPGKWALLSALLLIGVWYLIRDVSDALTRERTDEGFLRSLVLVAHFVCATPLLLAPPVQFSRRVRWRWPNVHRLLGQLYLACALIAAVAAIHLAVMFEEPGRRPPLFVFAVLWVFFVLAAWVTAHRKRFDTHQHFVSLTYAVALGFVIVRILGDFADQLFGFISSEEAIGITREWLCFVIPLVFVEFIYSWKPSLTQAIRRQR